MAVSANTVWEIRSTATAGNTNGGGFVTGASGVDYSQQNAAQYALTGGSTGAASATVSHASASADMVGNIAYVPTGTNITSGWYEIISVSAGSSITFDRNVTTAAATGISMNIGGAMSLGASNDSTFFNAGSAGNTYWIKAGTYNIGTSVSSTKVGTSVLPIFVKGYNLTRNDEPTGSNRPVINCGTGNFFNTYDYWTTRNVELTGAASTVFGPGSNGRVINCKVTNTSTTANRTALNVAAVNNCHIENTEVTSIRGRGITISTSAEGTKIVNCWVHSCDTGLYFTAANLNGCLVLNNIISDCTSYAIRIASAIYSPLIRGNTLYGTSSKKGVGLDIVTNTGNVIVENNIIYGFNTGIQHADDQKSCYDDYNNFYNNTNDVNSTAKWQKGANDTALDPQFTNVTEISGSTAYCASGSKFIDTSKNFTALGVVAGRDYLYVTGGTSITVGIYPISSITTTTNTNDTLVLGASPGTNATTDKTYTLTVGQDFSIGTNLKALGTPGAFQGGYSTGYTDIGAVQRQESGSGGGAAGLTGMYGGFQ